MKAVFTFALCAIALSTGVLAGNLQSAHADVTTPQISSGIPSSVIQATDDTDGSCKDSDGDGECDVKNSSD